MHDYGVFKVEKLTYEEQARDFFIYACPDWVNVVAETPEGVVMVWQYRHGTDALSLELPGGVVDPGETPIDAARRELREETGYEADTFELLSVVDPNPELQGNLCHSYVARNARKTADVDFDDEEDLETVVVPRGDIAALIDDRKIGHALIIVALEAYLRKG